MVIWKVFLENYESNINVVLIMLNIQSNMLCKFTCCLPFIEVHKQASLQQSTYMTFKNSSMGKADTLCCKGLKSLHVESVGTQYHEHYWRISQLSDHSKNKYCLKSSLHFTPLALCTDARHLVHYIKILSRSTSMTQN
jgi:hypothetical protein